MSLNPLTLSTFLFSIIHEEMGKIHEPVLQEGYAHVFPTKDVIKSSFCMASIMPAKIAVTSGAFPKWQISATVSYLAQTEVTHHG